MGASEGFGYLGLDRTAKGGGPITRNNLGSCSGTGSPPALPSLTVCPGADAAFTCRVHTVFCSQTPCRQAGLRQEPRADRKEAAQKSRFYQPEHQGDDPYFQPLMVSSSMIRANRAVPLLGQTISINSVSASNTIRTRESGILFNSSPKQTAPQKYFCTFLHHSAVKTKYCAKTTPWCAKTK